MVLLVHRYLPQNSVSPAISRATDGAGKIYHTFGFSLVVPFRWSEGPPNVGGHPLEENSMKAIHHVRRTLLGRLATFVLLVMLVVTALPHGAAAAGLLPNSIVSTGDSITRAFNTGSFPFIDAP